MEGGFGLGGGAFADGVIELADGMVLGSQGRVLTETDVGSYTRTEPFSFS